MKAIATVAAAVFGFVALVLSTGIASADCYTNCSDYGNTGIHCDTNCN